VTAWTPTLVKIMATALPYNLRYPISQARSP
jgi:hypothetical protein